MCEISLTLLFFILEIFSAAGQENTAVLCSESTSVAFNVTQISGVWWEVARNPALNGLACVKVNFTEIQSENVMQIATTYAVSTTYLWVNQTMYANVSLEYENGNGYNISYSNGLTTTEYTGFKLLQTDYQNYALFCGYASATNNGSSFGIVLTRERYPNATQLNEIADAASALFADFTPSNMPLVTQSPTCYASGAELQNAILSAVLALVCALLNSCNRILGRFSNSSNI